MNHFIQSLLFSGMLGLAAAASIAYTPSCAAVPAITADVVDEVSCVAAQVEAGHDTFEDIALACGGMAVTDVITIVTTLASAAPDASATPLQAKAAAVHHKAAK
jgi:hypothetical protein